MKAKHSLKDIMNAILYLIKIGCQRHMIPKESLVIIDSRSVKTSHHTDTDRRLDGNKKDKGRKQHIIIDTQGNLTSITQLG